MFIVPFAIIHVTNASPAGVGVYNTYLLTSQEVCFARLSIPESLGRTKEKGISLRNSARDICHGSSSSYNILFESEAKEKSRQTDRQTDRHLDLKKECMPCKLYLFSIIPFQNMD